MNAGGQVQFAGDGHNGLRPVLQDNSPRQCSAGGHGDLQMVLIGEFDQIFNFTFSAAPAISNITRDLNLAFKILNAVGEEDQELIGPDPMAIRPDEMVVQFDKGLSDSFFRYADDPPHQDHEGKKDFGNQAS